MNWAQALTRDDIVENVAEYRDEPDFMAWRDSHLKRAVHAKDLELVRVLLDAGAGPDCIEAWNDSLQHHLVHEYLAVRSSNGAIVLAILDLILSHGANPNHVGANNWRAMDQAIDRNVPELVEVFVRHGGDRIQREFL